VARTAEAVVAVVTVVARPVAEVIAADTAEAGVQGAAGRTAEAVAEDIRASTNPN
jgi:hypothetical protein